MKLAKSEKFINEVNSFKSKIEKVTDENIKKDLSQTLSKLIQEVNYIDSQHNELSIQKRLPETIDSSRNTIGSYRKRLNDMLTSWEKKSKTTVI
jgi:DNA repair exonuclease SbcCD ATPase subunit